MHERSTHTEHGARFERASRDWLEQRGWQIIEQNYRCKAGEIDLIARDGEVLVFVEVRARRSRRYASAAASVDQRKQQRLRAAAAHFMRLRAGGVTPPCRFDVITWQPDAGTGDWAPTWIPRAFGGL
ncbi:MAG: YraN family protein [Lamprobacter sp.]|uniref:YraN family protein n=1 Tax=Lamprobacter sp. TaxID=3100796 RepID=UPI002B256B6A|nr:YraN family protein [Lamprobacter sp.]MEA3643917.1 YraN family protein [Lamprobacter sp.]